MLNDINVLLTALRAAAWRPIRNPGELGLGRLVIWSAVLIGVWIAVQYFHTRNTGGSFTPYGLNAMVAWLAVLLAVTGLFVPAPVRTTFLVISVALGVILDLAFELLTLPAVPYLTAFVGDSFGRWMVVWLSTLALYGIWWTGAVARILDGLQPERAPSLRRASAMWLVVLAGFAVVPHYPSFLSRDFSRDNANLWEFGRAAVAHYWPAEDQPDNKPPFDVAWTELTQPSLLEAMTAQLAAEQPGRTDVYFLGLAGWAQQDVFFKELKGALDALGRSIPVEGRVALLVNNPASVSDVPLANRQNFAAMVRAVSRRMNRDEDVLFLFLTSHGSRDGVALSLPGSIQAMLSPRDIADILDREGIKNRVVVVSACHSGVSPLANDDTIVLTAAHEDNTSFGCASDREWTYFGEALFKNTLKPGQDLQRAFDEAKTLIREWEGRDGVKPSDPQAHFGASLLRRLAPIHEARTIPERRAEAQR